MPGGHRRCRVIQNFLASGNPHGRSAKRSRDLARDSHRPRISLDRKNLSLKRRYGDPAERLQRMHGPDRRAMFPRRVEHPRVQRAAGVQHHFPAQFFGTNARKLLSNSRDFVIRRGNQNDRRRQDLPLHSSARLPSSDESNGTARTRLAARNDGADLPSQFAQTASQRSPHAAGADDRKATFHRVIA